MAAAARRIDPKNLVFGLFYIFPPRLPRKGLFRAVDLISPVDLEKSKRTDFHRALLFRMLQYWKQERITNMMYYLTAYTTLLSAVLGLCFSIGAVRTGQGNSRTNALYMFARSLALTCAALIPVCVSAPNILIAATAAMLIGQVVDWIIGIILKNKMRTAGPFLMAACHAVCLLLVV